MSKRSRRKNERPLTSVNAAVERLQTAAETMKASRNRYAANDFLAEVYRVYCEWLERDRVERLIQLLDQKIHLHQPKTRRPFKTLIVAANCSLEAKQRSRWIRTLEYALLTNTEPEDFIDMLGRNGGIAGCASLAAKYDPKQAICPQYDSWATNEHV